MLASFVARVTTVPNRLQYPSFRASASVCSQGAPFGSGIHRKLNRLNPSLPSSTPGPNNPRKILHHQSMPDWHQDSGFCNIPPTPPLRPIIQATLALPVLPRLLAQEFDSTHCVGSSQTVPLPLRAPDAVSPSSPMRVSWIKLSLIVQNPPLLPLHRVWAVSQSQCGRCPSRAGSGSSAWIVIYTTNYLIPHKCIVRRILLSRCSGTCSVPSKGYTY